MLFVGSIPALIISGKSLNMSSFLGIILLTGIVVDNGSLIYEYILIFKKSNILNPEEIILACKEAIRPILLNNCTTFLGMLPAVFEIGEGSEFQSPMAIAVTSGLIVSVILSLFLLPILFYKFGEKA
jgi:multidrug efflux pump subunit AcrB